MKIPQHLKDKELWQLILIGFIIIFCLHSCTTSNIHYSGNYTVSAVQGDTVHFSGISSHYKVVGSQFVKGQRVALKRTWNKSKVNVLLIVKK